MWISVTDLFPGTGLGHSSNSRFTGCGLHQCRGLITFDIAVMWCSQMDRHEKEGAEPDEGPSGPEETPSPGRAQDDGMHQAPLCYLGVIVSVSHAYQAASSSWTDKLSDDCVQIIQESGLRLLRKEGMRGAAPSVRSRTQRLAGQAVLVSIYYMSESQSEEAH